MILPFDIGNTFFDPDPDLESGRSYDQARIHPAWFLDIGNYFSEKLHIYININFPRLKKAIY